MIFGTVRVAQNAVETHRNTYLLSQLSVISISRPLLPTACLFAVGGGAFAVTFLDLLYVHELLGIVGFIILSLFAGLSIGQIQLLSRDLRGSELSTMIFGTYWHLQRVRASIFTAMHDQSDIIEHAYPSTKGGQT